MRVHINLDEDLVREVDDLVGPRGRSPYVAEAVREKVERDRRWEKIKSAVGSISDTGHPWDPDPAAWVHEQRHKGERPIR